MPGLPDSVPRSTLTLPHLHATDLNTGSGADVAQWPLVQKSCLGDVFVAELTTSFKKSLSQFSPWICSRCLSSGPLASMTRTGFLPL